MAKKGDVELVIRAKDAATQALDSVAKAIAGLVGSQDDLSKSAGKTDNALDRLKASFAGLEKELRGATVGAQVAKALESAQKASDRLNKSVEATKAQLAGLTKEQADAQASSARLTAEMERAASAAAKEAAALERAKKAVADTSAGLRQATNDRKQLQAADERLTAQIGAQSAAVDKAQAKIAKLSAELAAAQGPAKTLQSAFERATQSLANQQAKLADLSQTQAVVRAAIDQTGAATQRFAGQLEEATGAFQRQEATVAKAGAVYTELQAAVKSAAQQQKTLDAAASQTVDALARQNEAVNRSAVELQQLQAAAGKANVALADLAAGSTAKLTEAFNQQRRSMLETKREWVESQAAVKSLAIAMKGTVAPTEQQAKALNDALIAARASKAEYIAQRDGLQQLGKVLLETGGDIDTLVAQQEKFIAVQAQVGAALARVRTEAAQSAAAFQKVASASSAPTVRVPKADLPDPSLIDRLSLAYKDLYGNTRLAMSWTQRLRGEVLSLIAAYGGIFGVIQALGAVISAYKQLEAATSRLRVVFDGNQAKSVQELDFLRRTADRLGISFGTLADEYGKFAVATKGTNIGAADTRKIFLAVAEAGRVNKLSIEDMKGVFTALQQIVSKGKVQMEELRQQLGDRLPGAIQIMADALGVGTDELFKMVKANEVGSDALIKFADELNKRFGSALPAALTTTTTALGQLENAVFQALLAFGKAGFIKSFTDLVRELTKTLKSADFREFSASVSAGFATLVDVLTLVVKHFRLVVAAGTAFLALKMVPFVVAIGASLLRLTGLMAGVRGAIVATVFAMEGLGTAAGLSSVAVGRLAIATRALLSTTGIGLALTAIGVAIGFWATQATDTTAALSDLDAQLDIIKNGFEEANGSAEKFAEALKHVSTAKLMNDLIDLKKSLDDFKPKDAGGLFGVAPPIESLTPDFVGALDQVNKLNEEFRSGQKDLSSYKDELGKIAATANDDWLTKFIADNVDLAEKLQETRDKIALAEAALHVAQGTATDAEKALLGLTKTADDNAAAFKRDSAALEDWNKLLEEAQKALDGASGSTETFEQKLTTAFQTLVKGAKSLSEVTELVRQFNEALSSNDAADLMKGLGNLTDNTQAATSVIRNFEGFQPTGKWDKNAFRAGFGSSTVTLSDGSIKQITEGMSVSVADANRDLARRVALEFKEIVSKIGAEKFSSLTPPQAGVLASIVHNYGHLPDQIVQAINHGGDVAAAIRGLAVGDVNDRRRNTEADIFAAGAGKDTVEKQAQEQEKLAKKQEEDDAKKLERAKEYHDTLADTITQEQEQNNLKDQGILKQEIAKALAEAENAAKKAGTVLSEEERQKIIAVTTAKFKEKQATDDIAAAEKVVADLVTRRTELQKQLKLEQASGDTTGVAATKAELVNVNAELLKAIANATAMHQAIGGSGADAAISKLKTIALETKNVSANAQEAWIDWSRVGQLFASGLTNAFDQFAQAVAEGQNVGEAARDAFLKFASDFLRQVAQMIIQQAILNALRSFGLGGGAGGAASSIASIFHSGGVVGRSSVSQRSINPAVFAGAQRFHEGGMPGLRPGEVAAIVQRDEEVLSKNDPRNIRNGGAAAGGGAPVVNGGSTSIINAFDTASFLEASLRTKVGQRAVLNFVSANAAAFKQTLAT